MRGTYATALVVGLVLLFVWIVAVALSESGLRSPDPERSFGRRGRGTVAGLVGFGMAGLSASYAGWPVAGALVGAVAGAALASFYAIRTGQGG